MGGKNKKETNRKNESKCEGKEIHNYDRYKMKNEINKKNEVSQR